MADAGLASAADIDKAMVGGCNHPMGPLALTDLIGLDTTVAVAESMYAETKEQLYAAPALPAEGRGRRTRPQERPRVLHLLQALVNSPMRASACYRRGPSQLSAHSDAFLTPACALSKRRQQRHVMTEYVVITCTPPCIPYCHRDGAPVRATGLRPGTISIWPPQATPNPVQKIQGHRSRTRSAVSSGCSVNWHGFRCARWRR